MPSSAGSEEGSTGKSDCCSTLGDMVLLLVASAILGLQIAFQTGTHSRCDRRDAMQCNAVQNYTLHCIFVFVFVSCFLFLVLYGQRQWLYPGCWFLARFSSGRRGRPRTGYPSQKDKGKPNFSLRSGPRQYVYQVTQESKSEGNKEVQKRSSDRPIEQDGETQSRRAVRHRQTKDVTRPRFNLLFPFQNDQDNTCRCRA